MSSRQSVFQGFSLQEYIARYPEDQHIHRLLAIAKFQSDPLIVDQMAPLLYDRLKGSYQTNLFRDVSSKLFLRGYSECTIDENALSERERDSSRNLEKLQTALGNAQNKLVKEEIRTALNNLSDFYHKRGDMQNTMKMVNRSRESCTTDAHIFTMCLNAMRYNISVPNFASVASYLGRMESIIDSLGAEEYVVSRVAAALVQLDKRMYRSCAHNLLDLRKNRTTPAEFKAASVFLPPADIALIATITALATFERSDLGYFVQNADLKVIFETETELAQLADSFYNCEYAKALRALDALLPRIHLDFFLAPHASAIVTQIRTSAMKQYTYPFSTLDLKLMSSAFNIPLEDLRYELSSLIKKKVILARIDMANDILYASRTDNKAKFFGSALETATQFTEESEQMMRLLSMHRNGVSIASSRKGQHSRGGDRDGGDDGRGFGA